MPAIASYHISLRRLFPLFFCFFTLWSAACTSRTPLIDPFGGKSFWASKFRSGKVEPVAVPAVFLAGSENGRVYSELKNLISLETADELLRVFENSIAPTEHSAFTRPTDINGDGQVTILVLDIDDGSSLTRGQITGYFDPFNLFGDARVYEATCQNSSSTSCSRSNEQEMLYIDVSMINAGSKELYSTLAHEYQHVLHFAHDYRVNPDSITLESTWVNEGLSEVTSDLTGFGPQTSRLSAFSGIKGNALPLWNYNDPLLDYSHAYVYFRFLADTYGSTVLTRIFSSDAFDIAGVNQGISQLGDSTSFNTANCGNNQSPTNHYFDCTYRYMWAAVLGFTSGDGARGSTTSSAGFFSKPAKFAFASGNAPSVPSKGTANNVVLKPYAADLFDKNAGVSANLDNSGGACTSCDVPSFTLFYNLAQTQYLTYNHNTATSDNRQVNVSPSVSGPASSKTESSGKVCGSLQIDPSLLNQVGDLGTPQP